jgi:sugar transferase (PEP-CTERM/EpsH1 system associated)
MTSRPVIAHVVNSLGVGGLENGVVNLVNTTGPHFRHVVICMTTEGTFRDRLEPAVQVFAIGKGPGHDVRAFARLVGLLRQLRPAVVHSRNWATFDSIAAARIARVPVVVHGEHGRDITDPNGQNPRRNRLRRTLSPLVDRFVTVSHDLRRWLVDDVHLPERKVITIHNGVDLARFGHLSRPEARRLLNLPAESIVVGAVGRLDPVKNQASLIRAFTALRSSRRDVLLVIAGDGPCWEYLAALITSLGVQDRVLLLGERRDIPIVLAAIDLFVLPSIAEGISNTILEAMASGLPVVATRVGGNPELVEHGISGTLVPSLDPAALTAAIEMYLDDAHLRALHGKASRQRAVDHFDLGRMAEAHINLYTVLLDGRHSRGA